MTLIQAFVHFCSLVNKMYAQKVVLPIICFLVFPVQPAKLRQDYT